MRKKQVHRQKLSEILSKYNFGKLTPEQENLRVEDNIIEINKRFGNLTEYVGRELTEDEESKILDIVDEYTPKYNNGSYLVDLLPFDYAWRIYEAKKDAELGEFIDNLKVDL